MFTLAALTPATRSIWSYSNRRWLVKLAKHLRQDPRSQLWSNSIQDLDVKRFDETRHKSRRGLLPWTPRTLETVQLFLKKGMNELNATKKEHKPFLLMALTKLQECGPHELNFFRSNDDAVASLRQIIVDFPEQAGYVARSKVIFLLPDLLERLNVEGDAVQRLLRFQAVHGTPPAAALLDSCRGMRRLGENYMPKELWILLASSLYRAMESTRASRSARIVESFKLIVQATGDTIPDELFAGIAQSFKARIFDLNSRQLVVLAEAFNSVGQLQKNLDLADSIADEAFRQLPRMGQAHIQKILELMTELPDDPVQLKNRHILLKTLRVDNDDAGTIAAHP